MVGQVIGSKDREKGGIGEGGGGNGDEAGLLPIPIEGRGKDFLYCATVLNIHRN